MYIGAEGHLLFMQVHPVNTPNSCLVCCTRLRAGRSTPSQMRQRDIAAFGGLASFLPERPSESQAKLGIKMAVIPEPCFKNEEGGRGYFWLGLPLTNLHLPGFDCGSSANSAWPLASPEKPSCPAGCFLFFGKGSPLKSTNQIRVPFFPMATGHLRELPFE